MPFTMSEREEEAHVESPEQKVPIDTLSSEIEGLEGESEDAKTEIKEHDGTDDAVSKTEGTDEFTDSHEDQKIEDVMEARIDEKKEEKSDSEVIGRAPTSVSPDVRKSNALNLNVLNTSSPNILETKTEDMDVNDEIVDMNTVKSQEMSVGDMTSLDSYNHTSEVQPPKTGKKGWFDLDKKDDADVTKEIAQELIDQHPRDTNLILKRYKENLVSMESTSKKDKESLRQGNELVKKTFQEVKTGVEYTHNEELIERIDWEFWSNVVNDYSSVVYKREDELIGHITEGIPDELRGMIWQILCESKSANMESFFATSRNEVSIYEKQIRRDLARTSFVTKSLKSQIDDLYEIIKAYSVFDKEVGYTQGMAFITVPILLNMEASETFCMLVKLMFTYGFRDFYLPNMPGLRLRMYQLDRLIEERMPDLAHHFKKEGIKSSMYATQWFLTLFAYKFPLGLVQRVFDVVIAEGLESILQFSINLLQKNKETLLSFKFEELLGFLKEGIFQIYADRANEGGYLIDAFVGDAMQVAISSMELRKYVVELEEVDRLEEKREAEMQDLRIRNGQLTRQIREIETAYSILNKEHIEIANEMVKGKMKIGTLEEEKAALEETNADLRVRLESVKQDSGTTSIDFSGAISEGIDAEIQKAMERNLEVMEENMRLEEQLSQLEEENNQLKKTHKGLRFW